MCLFTFVYLLLQMVYNVLLYIITFTSLLQWKYLSLYWSLEYLNIRLSVTPQKRQYLKPVIVICSCLAFLFSDLYFMAEMFFFAFFLFRIRESFAFFFILLLDAFVRINYLSFCLHDR